MTSSTCEIDPFYELSGGVRQTPALADQGGQPPRDCAQEFESAQRLRKEGKLKAAAEASISCSQPACPAFDLEGVHCRLLRGAVEPPIDYWLSHRRPRSAPDRSRGIPGWRIAHQG